MNGPGLREKILHHLFQIGVLLKGVDGLFETIGGFVFVCVTSHEIRHVVFWLTQDTLLEDPDDWIAHSLRHAFVHFSDGRKILVGAYLLGHGIIKLLLVVGLWRVKLWVFPVALAVLGGFVGYQVYHLTSHPSVGLSVLTLIDVIIAALVWHEFRSHLRRNR